MAQAVKVDRMTLAKRGYRAAQQKNDADRIKGLTHHQETKVQKTTETPVPTCQPVTIPAVPQGRAKLKVAAYCRVSTLMDSQESSIEAQRLHYEKTIRENEEWEYAGLYLEAGVSGTKAETRPELMRLMEDCRNGKVDLVLTKSISRFARNTSDCLEMVRTLTGLGVNIVFEKELIDTRAMDSEFILSILACFAEDESHSISGNMKWGIRKRFENGSFRQSIAPYGYAWKDNELVVVPEQAEVVREIFELALSGHGAIRIAKELNARKIPSPAGKLWTQRGINTLIANPVYVGDQLYQKTYMDEQFRQRQNRGELDRYYNPDHHEPIVSREAFDRAQGAMQQRAKEVGYSGGEEGRGTNRYCFSGILVCKACGNIMHRQKRKNGTACWVCGRHVNHPDSCRMKPQSDDDLKAAFVNCLNKLAWAQNTRGSSNRVLDVYEGLVGKSEAEKNKERLEEIEVLLEQNRHEMKKLQAVIMRERFLPCHRETMTALTSEEQKLLSEKNRLLVNGTPNGTLQQLKAFIGGWKMTGSLEDFPEEEFTRFVERCTVNAGKMVTFHFRCGLALTESLYRSTLEED